MSRIDLYADVQGWPLRVEDMRRFVSRARGREGHPLGEEEGAERFWMLGRDLTGFDFGRRGGGGLRAGSMTRRSRSGGVGSPGSRTCGARRRRSDEPVWRIEFELRRTGHRGSRAVHRRRGPGRPAGLVALRLIPVDHVSDTWPRVRAGQAVAGGSDLGAGSGDQASANPARQ